ncbi:MAG: hypothetical protein AB1546_00910, partial [bacterium]
LYLITFFTPIPGYIMMLTVGLFFFPKYYFYLLPLLILLILHGWDVPGRATLRKVVYAILTLISCFSTVQYYIGVRADEDNASVISYIEDNMLKGDIVLVNPPYLSLLFDFYAPETIYAHGIPENYIQTTPYTGIRKITEGDIVHLETLLNKYQRAWVFYGLGTHTRVDPEAKMEKWLKERYRLAETRNFIIAPFKGRDGILYLFEIQNSR